jgi:hypothetical protein
MSLLFPKMRAASYSTLAYHVFQLDSKYLQEGKISIHFLNSFFFLKGSFRCTGKSNRKSREFPFTTWPHLQPSSLSIFYTRVVHLLYSMKLHWQIIITQSPRVYSKGQCWYSVFYEFGQKCNMSLLLYLHTE